MPRTLDFGFDGLITFRGKTGDFDASREPKAQLDAHTVHSLSGVEVGAGPQRLDMLHFIAEEQVGRAAGNVEEQRFLAEELFTLGGKQCRRRMALLMGRADERDPRAKANASAALTPARKQGI